MRQRSDDLKESLDYQSATSDVLKVISRSGFNLQSVLDTLVATAVRLCHADLASINLRDGEVYRVAANFDYSPELNAYARNFPMAAGRGTITGRTALERQVVHVADVAADPEYVGSGWVTLGKVHTGLGVPLLRDREPIGVIALFRRRVEPFTERQIELVRTFADQAVVAMENARLLDELRQRTGDLQESLEYQTATSDVLKVISRSTFALQPILDTLVETAARLCQADMAGLNKRVGEVYRTAATFALNPEYLTFVQNVAFAPGRGTIIGRVALARQVVHVADLAADPEYELPEAVKLAKFRTALGVPLLREGEAIGVIFLARDRVEPFTARQIELVRTFADQAVIAMENARLLGELRERTDDLQESLEYQTATSDVLKVISRSSVNLEPVLDTLVETVVRLCRADQAGMYRLRDGGYHLIASRGLSDEAKEFRRTHPPPTDRGSMSGRAMLERRAVHIPDVLQDPEYTYEGQKVTGYRTLLGVPLLREETLVGTLVVTRTRAEPFTDKEIELVRTFADQAVIAIENARLFEGLRESLEQPTATAEVLQVINTSQGDLKPVFDAILGKALRLSHSAFGIMRTFDGEHFQLAAEKNVPQAYMDFTNKRLTTLVGAQTLGGTVARVITEKRVHQIVDAKDNDLYRQGDPMRRAVVDLAGARTILFVPLLRDDVVHGTIMVFRTEVQAFSEKEIALLQNFAAQAVIAMDNARLLGELRERQAELRVTFDNMGDGVVLFDTNQRLAAWNRNFQEILDLPNALLESRLTYHEYIKMLAERGEFGTLENIEEELARRMDNLDTAQRCSPAHDRTARGSKRAAIPCRVAASC